MPLSAPAIVTVVVVNAVWVWNELLIALVFLQDDNARTLTAGLTFFQGRFQSNEPLVMTGALIATDPDARCSTSSASASSSAGSRPASASERTTSASC